MKQRAMCHIASPKSAIERTMSRKPGYAPRRTASTYHIDGKKLLAGVHHDVKELPSFIFAAPGGLLRATFNLMQRPLDILLVEDDPVLGPLTAESLSGYGHRVTLSSTTKNAFEHLKAPHAFNVIILDIQLGADRAENLIDRLKAAGIEFPAVVLFSAQPSSELARSARTVKASGTVQKPCTVEQINRILERAVA